MINDENFQNLIKFDKNYNIQLTVRGTTDIYEARKNPDDSYELFCLTKQNTVYGLSCKDYIDIIGVLLCDYSAGIIDNAKLIEKREINSMFNNLLDSMWIR